MGESINSLMCNRGTVTGVYSLPVGLLSLALNLFRFNPLLGDFVFLGGHFSKLVWQVKKFFNLFSRYRLALAFGFESGHSSKLGGGVNLFFSIFFRCPLQGFESSIAIIQK